MRLQVVGLSHRTAPIELRECVDFARGGIDAALKALSVRGAAQESVILSTCNRAEVYAIIESDTATETIGRFFSEYHQLDHRETAEHLYTLNGGEAARHLFRVAAGLDSLVVGEPQILGQVKSAYTVGERPAAHRLDPQQALSLLVRRREACPFRDRPRRRRRLGQLRGHRVGEEDFRQALRPWSPDPRRRRNGQAYGHSPEGAAGPADDDREPHVEGGRRPRRAARRKGRPLDGISIARSCPQTSS